MSHFYKTSKRHSDALQFLKVNCSVTKLFKKLTSLFNVKGFWFFSGLIPIKPCLCQFAIHTLTHPLHPPQVPHIQPPAAQCCYIMYRRCSSSSLISRCSVALQVGCHPCVRFLYIQEGKCVFVLMFPVPDGYL